MRWFLSNQPGNSCTEECAGNLGTPYRYRRLETTGAVSVSCIRVHISEIGEIDVPGTWGQCKYYAYRGMGDGVGREEEGRGGEGKGLSACGQGECAPRMDIDRPSSFRRHQGPEVLCRHLSALITGVLSRSIWECRYSARQIVPARSSFFSTFFF